MLRRYPLTALTLVGQLLTLAAYLIGTRYLGHLL